MEFYLFRDIFLAYWFIWYSWKPHSRHLVRDSILFIDERDNVVKSAHHWVIAGHSTWCFVVRLLVSKNRFTALIICIGLTIVPLLNDITTNFLSIDPALALIRKAIDLCWNRSSVYDSSVDISIVLIFGASNPREKIHFCCMTAAKFGRVDKYVWLLMIASPVGKIFVAHFLRRLRKPIICLSAEDYRAPRLFQCIN